MPVDGEGNIGLSRDLSLSADAASTPQLPEATGAHDPASERPATLLDRLIARRTIMWDAPLKDGGFAKLVAPEDLNAAIAVVEAAMAMLAERAELLDALKRAQQAIDQTREELHQRRVSDWYPEGANNAALQMSEDMRLIGNALADIDFSATIARAEATNA